MIFVIDRSEIALHSNTRHIPATTVFALPVSVYMLSLLTVLMLAADNINNCIHRVAKTKKT